MSPDLPGFFAYGAAALQAVVRYAWPGATGVWSRRWVFVILLAGALGVFQREAIRANFQLWNPDESQMLAGALVLQERPVFWHDVDGGSHGPLVQFPLVLPGLLGQRIDYTAARVMAAGLTVLLLLALHAALACRQPEGVARLLVLPAWSLLIFNQDPEIAQYTSELMPSLLVALAFALWPPPSGERSGLQLLLAGLACGAAPLAKLQIAPVAAVLGLGFCLVAWSAPAARPGVRFRRVGLLVAGALLPAVFFVSLAAAAGAFDDFWISYIETNLSGYIPAKQYFNQALPSPRSIFGFTSFLWPVAAASLLALAWRRPDWNTLGWFGVVAAATAMTCFTIYAPQKPFGHYFLFLVGPLTLWLGATAGPLLADWAGRLDSRSRAGVAFAALLALALPVTAHHVAHPGYLRAIVPSRPPVPRPLIEAVQRHVLPGESLAVWGWQPALYVFAQATAAPADLVVLWHVLPSPWREFYQERYLRDLATRRPVLFVDTMGPADFFFFRPNPDTPHESFPELRDFIARDYVLVETVGGARLYQRRDRAAVRMPGL